MSSDDSEFDKEAEREKLRKKYEEDTEDREATQRMSELLLQGATMTGKHCGECGDPIFRYDGQEFCPTCQREVGGGQAGADQSGEPADAAGQSDVERATEAAGNAAGADAAADESANAGTAANAQGTTDAGEGDEPRVEINDVRVADRHADRADARQPPSQTDDRDQDADRGRVGHRHQHRASGDAAPRRRTTDRRGGDRRASDADPEAARESLVRTLNDLARRAEESDDVGRTRDLLAATREAAEALAALDRP